MDKYWKDRRRKEEKKAWDIANRSANWQEDFYKQAYKRIETEINALYAEIQSGGKSLDQLTRSELWRYKHYVQLQNVIEQESKTIGSKQLSLMDSTLDNVFRSVMGTELHDSGSSVTLLDNSALRQIKETVWSGESYSDRIWTNTNALAQRTKDKLTDLVAIGKLPEEVKKELQKEFNVSYRVADRLIRTEASHVFNTASVERYEEAGVEQVEVLVEDDEKICDDCLALDGKVFDIDKAPTLPIHPNCRCCYVPVVDRKNEYQKPEPEAEDKLAMVEDYEPPHLTRDNTDVRIKTTAEWENATFINEKKLQHHIDRHLAEYGDITVKEYLEGARNLLSQPVGGSIDGFKNNSGAIYRYDKKSNDFAIGKDGVIFTRFKPDLNRFPNYWEDVKNENYYEEG